ncbi:Nif11-like leader peptide family RiPP precursor [Cylindrospermum sp. FACHB-282]|uniref:Nif11-like leader peptide family RiPP precursor n=1 Tax=Cylindrospermum sp. FACHB-282 TaxID=2692794 RepID=UPI001684FF35|nr:Nif11-like leader peptide family RiPP precursor [Cylindrospermum sp. FACHB-282]MBD2387085.1 Nif11-like leader peptide family natural product precursor [Cylindrospermum sp. FACHB-282]
MSTNDKLHQFLQAVGQNQQLQQELLAVLEAAEDDRQATAELAQKYGYELSAEEIGDGIERIQSEFLTVNHILSDAELEAVSGGTTGVCVASVAATAAAATLAGGWKARETIKW